MTKGNERRDPDIPVGKVIVLFQGDCPKEEANKKS
jgi:hypothetical protein